MSGPSYGALASAIFCQLPDVFDPLLAAIFSQGKSSQPCTGIQSGHLTPQLTQALYERPPSCIRSYSARSLRLRTFSQSHALSAPDLAFFPSGRQGLLICLCYAMCLTNGTFHFASTPHPPSAFFAGFGMGWGSLLSKDPCSDLPCYTWN